MKRNVKIKFSTSLLIASVLGLGLNFNANAQARKIKSAFSSDAAIQQPLYTEYKGVRLGMSGAEVRAKLGTPSLQDKAEDIYVVSESECAQIYYDAALKVVTISVDYMGGIGAPDYKAIVGGELKSTNGSLYRLARYESLGFWVSYNRTTGAVPTVTITMQKIWVAS